MYSLAVSATFSAAHRLRNYRGRCERTHGHNWKVEVRVAGRDPGKNGMVMDFALLKGKTQAVLKTLDHRDLNALRYFRDLNPTAENLAKYVHDRLEASCRRNKVAIVCVTVWESEDSRASYSRNTAPLHAQGAH